MDGHLNLLIGIWFSFCECSEHGCFEVQNSIVQNFQVRCKPSHESRFIFFVLSFQLQTKFMFGSLYFEFEKNESSIFFFSDKILDRVREEVESTPFQEDFVQFFTKSFQLVESVSYFT